MAQSWWQWLRGLVEYWDSRWIFYALRYDLKNNSEHNLRPSSVPSLSYPVSAVRLEGMRLNDPDFYTLYTPPRCVKKAITKRKLGANQKPSINVTYCCRTVSPRRWHRLRTQH